MALNKTYKVYIQTASLNAGLQFEVTPLNSSIEWKGESVPLVRGLQKNISTQIKLSGSDYQTMYNLDNSVNNCDVVNIYIDTRNGNVFEREFEGLVKLKKSRFNVNDCTVELAIEPKNATFCFIENQKEIINLIDKVAFKPAAFSVLGTLEQITCGYTAFVEIPINGTIKPDNTTCITAGQGWTMYERRYRNIAAGVASGFFNVEIQTKWARQVVTSVLAPTLGTGWINIGGGQWARPVTVTLDSLTGDYSNPLSGDITEINIIDLWGADTLPKTYDNGMYIGDVFAALINQTGKCTYDIVSNLLRFNEDATNPTNTAYNAVQNVSDFILWQITDVKRYAATNNATKAETTPEDLIQDILNVFNAEIDIETAVPNNRVRIEHISYWDSLNGLDLVPRWQDVTEANAYTYEGDNLPRRETFKWGNETDVDEKQFDAYQLVYNANCTDAKEEKIIQAQNITTNFELIHDNNSISESGFAMAATIENNSQNFIISDTMLNDSMTAEKMIDNFLYYHRPLASADYNGVTKTFIQKPSKIETLAVANFTAQQHKAFLPSRRVNSKIGWGVVKGYSYDAKKCILKLEIVH